MATSSPTHSTAWRFILASCLCWSRRYILQWILSLPLIFILYIFSHPILLSFFLPTLFSSLIPFPFFPSYHILLFLLSSLLSSLLPLLLLFFHLLSCPHHTFTWHTFVAKWWSACRNNMPNTPELEQCVQQFQKFNDWQPEYIWSPRRCLQVWQSEKGGFTFIWQSAVFTFLLQENKWLCQKGESG